MADAGVEDGEEGGAIRNRGNTRAQLVRAGRTLFFRGELQSVSIDRVARDAGFTRAAFYLHFSSKDDLIAAIMLAESDKPIPDFQWFKDHPRDAASIEAFVRNFLDQSRRFRVREFHIAALQSSAALEAYRQNRARLTRVLGESFPAFRPARDDSLDEMRRVARATAIIVQIEQLSVREYEMGGKALGDAMVDYITEQMHRLDTDYPG
ncbi:MAG: TetR/AcrR family transcriptional regulator [Sphingobium sp.]